MKKAVLLGNPNVGKSIIFNALTGLGVEISNYPGTTVTVQTGPVKHAGEEFTVTDLPGIYSLAGDSVEEQMVREYIASENPDLFVVILDSAALEKNLFLLLQVADFGKPVLAVLNMTDDAEKAGKLIDADRLTEIFGIPFIKTVATEGKNLDVLAETIVKGNLKPAKQATSLDEHIKAAKDSLKEIQPISDAEALFALEGISLSTIPEEICDIAGVMGEEIEKLHAMSPLQIVRENRYYTAAGIAKEVTSDIPKKKRRDLDSLLTRSFPGIPILILTMLAVLLIVFKVGGFLEESIVTLMTTYIEEPFHALGLPAIVDTVGGSVILAITAGLGIAFPYVFLFFIFISILEDTGYLTRAAFLADRFMHRLGLHGQGIIPFVLSFGCTVPAVLSTSLLPTKRSRFISSVLVTMLPCSARTVVISGVVASFIGIGAAFSIYAIVFVLVFIAGCVLSKVTPGEQFGMILEMSKLRRPIPKYVFKKAWLRLKEFLYIAMPLLLVSSIFLGLFEHWGWVELFESFIGPVSEAVLGIPGFAFTALLFGILRKEMAFETLAVMGGSADLLTIMTAPQLYIFALVCVLFVPCISTIAVLGKQLGAKTAIGISLFTVSLGIIIGALCNLGFMLFI